MRACEAELVAIDFESTGKVQGYPDQPWQIGMVLFTGGQVQPQRRFESLLQVGDRPFNRYAPGRHAELRIELDRAPTLQALWPPLAPWLTGRLLAAHNAATEKRFLKNAFPLHRVTGWVDTLKLARLAWPGLNSYALEALSGVLGFEDELRQLCPGRRPHDALYDAYACALLLRTILRLPGWQQASLDVLLHAHRPGRRHT